MEYYRRKLPHWQISGAEYFVTFRLAGSLPVHVVKELQELRRRLKNLLSQNPENKKTLKRKLESKLFQKYEDLLDSCSTGPKWLEQPEVAEIIQESLHFRDNQEYDLYAYCIMSNHVHIVFRHLKREQKKDENNKLPPITIILNS